MRRETERVLDCIAKGIGDLDDLGARRKAVAAERRALEAELARAEPAPVITLHPGAIARYEAQLAHRKRSGAPRRPATPI